MSQIEEIPQEVVDNSDSIDERTQNLERRLLESDDTDRKLRVRDSGQRYKLRWIAIGVGIVVLIGMGVLLWRTLSCPEWRGILFSFPSVAIAYFIGPVASITAITIALFVGAFRKFKDDDLDGIATAAAKYGSNSMGRSIAQ